MADGDVKTQWGLALLAAAIVVHGAISACAHRYSFHKPPGGMVQVYDHWTGRVK